MYGCGSGEGSEEYVSTVIDLDSASQGVYFSLTKT